MPQPPNAYYMLSLGCSKNTVDSERILGDLGALGWEPTDDVNKADCLIVNTCGFIKDAVLESVEALDEICEVKKQNPNVIIVAAGCLPQRENLDLSEHFPELDIIAGVGSLADIPALIESHISGKSGDISNIDLSKSGRSTLSNSNDPRSRLSPGWSAWMKISEGCDHKCAFCTIPSIKGPHISRPVDDLVQEAKILASQGVKELILVSQDTTAYGTDIGTNLKNLLGELDKVSGINWIRLHYLYPSKVSSGLLDIIADSEKILPYFDIPIQHVQPGILRRMDRLAPDTDILELVTKIRDRFSNAIHPACIRATIIAGFPGETVEDFNAILEFIEHARIDRLTVFPFSPEDGTPASELDNQVDQDVIESRVHQLMELQSGISREINMELEGIELDVILEGRTSDGDTEYRTARSYRDAPEIDGMVIVREVPTETPEGTFVRVRVTAGLEYDLEAERSGDLES